MAAELFVDRKKITRPPTHPGVLFERDILPELTRPRRTIGEIATLLGVSRQALHRVMSGEAATTPDMAARLGTHPLVPRPGNGGTSGPLTIQTFVLRRTYSIAQADADWSIGISGVSSSD